MISERLSCATGDHFCNLRLHYYYLFQEAYDMSHNVKPRPVKTVLNCITTKFTDTMQALCSAGISSRSLPALWEQKSNFCGMSNMLTNCSGCVKKDNVTKTNGTQQYFSRTIYMSAFLLESLGGERGKGVSKSPSKEWGGSWVPVNYEGRHEEGGRNSKLFFVKGKGQTSLGGGDLEKDVTT